MGANLNTAVFTVGIAVILNTDKKSPSETLDRVSWWLLCEEVDKIITKYSDIDARIKSKGYLNS